MFGIAQKVDIPDVVTCSETQSVNQNGTPG